MSTMSTFASPLASSQVAQPFASSFAPSPPTSTPADPPTMFLQAIFESMMHGVLILNDKREVIQANRQALALCEQLNMGDSLNIGADYSPQYPNTEVTPKIPEAVWNVCRALLASRQDFPGYSVIPEDELDLGNDTHLKIYAQWLNVNDDAGVGGNAGADSAKAEEQSYMLVTLEDRTEMLRNLARWDARRYGLTPREAEVWLLKCQNYSYDEIAAELYISRNTVKKHLKSISLKRGNEVD